jgi:predicted transcriptional regulator
VVADSVTFAAAGTVVLAEDGPVGDALRRWRERGSSSSSQSDADEPDAIGFLPETFDGQLHNLIVSGSSIARDVRADQVLGYVVGLGPKRILMMEGLAFDRTEVAGEAVPDEEAIDLDAETIE